VRSARTAPAIGGVPAARFALPVSGTVVSLRQPTGAEDVLLAEHDPEDPALVLLLAEQLGFADPAAYWAELPVPDIDALVVRLRQAMIGDRVVADLTCACGQRVDVSFSLETYLAYHQPNTPAAKARGWAAAPVTDEPGWYELRTGTAEPIRFRLPTLADQIAAGVVADPAAALAARCIRPPLPPRAMRARVEAAMAALAPPLAGPIQGRCPDCAATIEARFVARTYCLTELRDRARFVYDDVDTLAERYHWTEQAILTLPHARRAGYAERARQARVA
jgi:hypothetical protein